MGLVAIDRCIKRRCDNCNEWLCNCNIVQEGSETSEKELFGAMHSTLIPVKAMELAKLEHEAHLQCTASYTAQRQGNGGLGVT
jgi:hypothetical protein